MASSVVIGTTWSMENYVKGENVEESLDLSKVPIPNLPSDVLWMQVRGGTKMTNVLDFVMAKYKDNKDISCLWTGFGPSVGKTISCAEIMKKEFGNKLHQITKICYRTVEEYWDPVIPELDQLVVKRKLPMIHVYLSSKPLEPSEPGYQAPGQFVPYQPKNTNDNKRKPARLNKTNQRHKGNRNNKNSQT